MTWNNAHTNPPATSGWYRTRDVRWPDDNGPMRYNADFKQWYDDSGDLVIFGMDGREGRDEWSEVTVSAAIVVAEPDTVTIPVAEVKRILDEIAAYTVQHPEVPTHAVYHALTVDIPAVIERARLTLTPDKDPK